MSWMCVLSVVISSPSNSRGHQLVRYVVPVTLSQVHAAHRPSLCKDTTAAEKRGNPLNQ